jgi:hypothetical protein
MRGADIGESQVNTRVLLEMCEHAHPICVSSPGNVQHAIKALIASMGTAMMDDAEVDRTLSLLMLWKGTRAKDFEVAIADVPEEDRARMAAIVRLEEGHHRR